MRYPKTLLGLLCLLPLFVWADEGMWMPGHLNKKTYRAMKDMGLELSMSQLYSPNRSSLKDAVVSFGGFCSGVVVSKDGLVFTNHHCGFHSIQQQSTVAHDYLKDGFAAHTRVEELPCPELYVRFLVEQKDVTRRVLRAVTDGMDENQRRNAVDSVTLVIQDEVSAKDSTLLGVVDTYYAGNEFWLSVYRDYNDVRLVFAPPSSIGKFGWDTDNWMWPRHTGDFSVFRIYAGPKNRPADYSPTNVPYQASKVVPLSLEGYRQGTFTMTMGYPGSTNRYLSSFGIEERMENQNEATIDIRSVKQRLWKKAMSDDDTLRIKYASKYDESSNYYKNSIGMNRSLRSLGVVKKKQAMERSLQQWIESHPEERAQHLRLLTDLELAYKNRKEVNRALAYFTESFMNSPELLQLSFVLLNFDSEAPEKEVEANLKSMVEKYLNLDVDVDKEVFTAVIDRYRKAVPPAYLPPMYESIEKKYGGNDRAFVDSLYASTLLDTPEGMKRFFSNDTTFHLMDDPAISLMIDLIVKYYDMNVAISTCNAQVDQGERNLNAAIRRLYSERNYYPDANSTMRLSFGSVAGYSPQDGMDFDYYTTTRGILEKWKEHRGDSDYDLQPHILQALHAGEWGHLSDGRGELRTCFISNNDITGGNSGSAVFSARGELMGLAFDGNWEAMSSDFLFDENTQRSINVDVRYMLYVIGKLGGATSLMQELGISDTK